MLKTLLTFTDVAKRAGVTRKTLYKWQRSGRFNAPAMPGYKPPRWHASDIDEWLKPQSVPVPADAIGG